MASRLYIITTKLANRLTLSLYYLLKESITATRIRKVEPTNCWVFILMKTLLLIIM